MINSKIGAIVLAAGSSSRLGRPKQLLQYKGKSLLKHTVEEILQSNYSPIVVVLGANTKAIEAALQGLDVIVIKNMRWQEGMGTSIQAGIEMMELVGKSMDGTLVTLCDQPFINSSYLDELSSVFSESTNKIIASQYQDTIGVPAIFRNDLFRELYHLAPQKGAKSLIQRHKESTILLAFENGEIDIDTEEDYAQLLRRKKTASQDL